jgi:hypothetical protein
MYAVLTEVEIDTSRSDEAEKMLHDVIVPSVRATRGFVNGYWFRSEDGTRGRATLLFDSEEAARTARENAPAPPEGAPATFVRADVCEVVAQA